MSHVSTYIRVGEKTRTRAHGAHAGELLQVTVILYRARFPCAFAFPQVDRAVSVRLPVRIFPAGGEAGITEGLKSPMEPIRYYLCRAYPHQKIPSVTRHDCGGHERPERARHGVLLRRTSVTKLTHAEKPRLINDELLTETTHLAAAIGLVLSPIGNSFLSLVPTCVAAVATIHFLALPSEQQAQPADN